MISVRNLSKSFGPTRAVRDVSFEIARGEVVGFLGPNGAGKTTTMRIITCYMPADSGSATVAGFDTTSQSLEVRRRIGYLPESAPLYDDMGVVEYLSFVAGIRGIQKALRTQRIREMVERCGLEKVVSKDIGDLSKGYRQRVGLAQTLIHNPDILVLDEPTSGLDPNQIVEIRELIREIGKHKTVILSSHILPEVQATCNRVLIINDGKIVADAKPDALLRSETKNQHRMLLAIDGGPVKADATAAVKELDGVAGVAATVHAGTGLELSVESDGGTDLRLALSKLAAAREWPLLELDRREASLEEVFGQLTRTETDE